jgi:hypothetical protein
VRSLHTIPHVAVRSLHAIPHVAVRSLHAIPHVAVRSLHAMPHVAVRLSCSVQPSMSGVRAGLGDPLRLVRFRATSSCPPTRLQEVGERFRSLIDSLALTAIMSAELKRTASDAKARLVRAGVCSAVQCSADVGPGGRYRDDGVTTP